MPYQSNEVLYGSTIRDSVHKGPNQAGNKSLLAYRADIGVPGYTGFIPGPNSVRLPIKGFDHTGKPLDASVMARTAVETVDPKKTTKYQEDYKKQADDTKSFSKTGGGYWISDRRVPPSIPFVATTTYRAETLSGDKTAAEQLERSEGLVPTLVGYEAALQANEMRRSQSAEPSSRAMGTARGIGNQTVRPATSGSASRTAAAYASASVRVPPAQASTLSTTVPRPETVPTSFGELPGYQTTYTSMTDKSSRLLGESLQTRSASAGPPGDPRWKVLPRVMAPTMGRAYSTYKQEYGDEGFDPMTRQAPEKSTMTRLSTTRDLANGTTRNTCNIPRYTGHMPASQYASDEGRVQGEAAEPRTDQKSSSLLFTLDQYSRTRVPGYTGAKPTAPCNVTTAMPSRGPNSETTQGDAAMRGTRFGVPQQSHEHYINSREGLMTFFNNSNAGTEFVSDNGLFNAQVYYKECKALGALGVKHGRPSTVTHYGAPFRAAASMV